MGWLAAQKPLMCIGQYQPRTWRRACASTWRMAPMLPSSWSVPQFPQQNWGIYFVFCHPVCMGTSKRRWFCVTQDSVPKALQQAPQKDQKKKAGPAAPSKPVRYPVHSQPLPCASPDVSCQMLHVLDNAHTACQFLGILPGVPLLRTLSSGHGVVVISSYSCWHVEWADALLCVCAGAC